MVKYDKTTAFSLCLFLGWLGAHRFYQKRSSEYEGICKSWLSIEIINIGGNIFYV